MNPSKPVAQPDSKDFIYGHMSDSHDKDTLEGIAANLAHWIHLLLREREAAAERRGAEAMREKAVNVTRHWPGDQAEIRALPLPGDK